MADLIKSGYLTKLDVVSQKSWKKRFFALNASSISYFESHQVATKPKGSIVLVYGSTVQRGEVRSGKEFIIEIKTPFTLLILSANSEEECNGWIEAIDKVLKSLKELPRAYITKRGGIFEGGNSRKYFILHNDCLTWHQDEEHVKSIKGSIPLTSATVVNYLDANLVIDLGHENIKLQIQFDKADMHSYDVWKGCISEILKRPQSSIVNSDTATEGTNVTSAVEVRVLREGPLHIRPPKGGENWPLFTVRVTNTSVEVVESASDGLAIANSFPLTLSCAAFETNLGAHAFEVVTPTSVLHLRAENKEELDIWIKTIRDVILRSRPDPSDPLFHEAMMKINSDVIYDVVFPESKPLGIVLERAGEWGIVKISNAKDTNVFAGSALTAVNDQSVVLYNYADTISLLRGWKPPLKLVFRKAPAKEGFLMKQSTGKSASEVVGKNWKKRYFVLAEGRLMYRENADPTSALKGDMPLMGSAVSLMPAKETGKYYCFRLVSGVTSLVMQAESVEDMMDWASTLYHASFIANGGNHIVGLQRARAAHQKKKEEEAAKLEAVRNAELKKLEQDASRLQLAEEEMREEMNTVAVEANEALRNAMSLVRNTKPMNQQCIDTLKTALMNCRSIQGTDEVAIVEADMLWKNTVTVFEEQKIVLENMEKALKTDTVKSLSNVLVEASMLPGFEEEHLAIVSQVQDNLHRAKQRESLLVVLQLACDSKKYDHLPYLLGQAKELELSGECHSVVREAAQLLLTYSATSETVETADGQDGMDSRASLTSRDSDDSMDDSDGMGVRQHTNVAGQHHGRMEEDSDDEVSDAEPEATAEVVDSGKQQEPGSSTAVEDGVATLESPSKRLEFLNSTSKGSKLPMTDDYMGSSSGGSLSMAAPKKASRRGSAISYQELIIANKRANEEKHRCKLANTKSKRVFAPEELATREDISKLFRSYSKKLQDLASNSSLNSDLEFLNPMQFVSILRLVVGQKGNLFKEMQAFKKFDLNNNAALDEEEFVNGWMQYSKDEDCEEYLFNIKNMVRDDNMLL